MHDPLDLVRNVAPAPRSRALRVVDHHDAAHPGRDLPERVEPEAPRVAEHARHAPGVGIESPHAEAVAVVGLGGGVVQRRPARLVARDLLHGLGREDPHTVHLAAVHDHAPERTVVGQAADDPAVDPWVRRAVVEHPDAERVAHALGEDAAPDGARAEPDAVRREPVAVRDLGHPACDVHRVAAVEERRPGRGDARRAVEDVDRAVRQRRAGVGDARPLIVPESGGLAERLPQRDRAVRRPRVLRQVVGDRVVERHRTVVDEAHDDARRHDLARGCDRHESAGPVCPEEPLVIRRSRAVEDRDRRTRQTALHPVKVDDGVGLDEARGASRRGRRRERQRRGAGEARCGEPDRKRPRPTAADEHLALHGECRSRRVVLPLGTRRATPLQSGRAFRGWVDASRGSGRRHVAVTRPLGLCAWPGDDLNRIGRRSEPPDPAIAKGDERGMVMGLRGRWTSSCSAAGMEPGRPRQADPARRGRARPAGGITGSAAGRRSTSPA